MKENSTKEKIIEAAFSLYSTRAYEKLSLSKVASKVGITKTAIYRHFKNKESLIETMKQRLYEECAECFTQFTDQNFELKKLLPELFIFFTEKPYYMSFLLSIVYTEQRNPTLSICFTAVRLAEMHGFLFKVLPLRFSAQSSRWDERRRFVHRWLAGGQPS